MFKIQSFLLSLLLIGSALSAAHAQSNIIPMPISVVTEGELVDLSKGIVIDTSQLTDGQLQQIQAFTTAHHIPMHNRRKIGAVRLLLKSELTTQVEPWQEEEAYELKVRKRVIVLSANHQKGFHNALQTLRQLDVRDRHLQKMTINDAPAFPFRGLLLDVGRNFLPLELIKEQIDFMALYKLNVLHFHFTEDIAWRLFSNKYPGLTAAENMLRNKGDLYTTEQFQEIIDYCKQNNILLLPEIDMPGHSDAFTRFFGVDMQSEKGLVHIKELLKEFKENFPELDFLHIGGDEVEIKNKQFMPEITRYVESLGFNTTMGWDPGSNLEPQTIKQLWMGGPERLEESESTFIDSKHLYINHMDPLETVTTLFYRKFGEVGKHHSSLLGATLCVWPDRVIGKPLDMYLQSAVYPGMLSFSERVWRGGGLSRWVANIPTEKHQDMDFIEFEARLLHHKNTWLKGKPFPYQKQSHQIWDLIGPYANGGDVFKTFDLEEDPTNQEVHIAQKAIGGTVVLRHWWDPFVTPAIENPQENTTWYARRFIWSDEEVHKKFWIGFNDLSRSYASDSPELNTWDDKGSKVWVNGSEVKPPVWTHAGEKGDMERPYVDEGYSYREPTLIPLKKGWNVVLLKVPVASFKGNDWQNPTKWMFTFIEVED